ncbi:MAG: transcriptional regulator [candidate division TM6 bacterium GW2011_GWF2_32_72]|nr:MAG: transcriptional regulator [candidate division TM6 bacterium GW2011_GWF2_32_72]
MSGHSKWANIKHKKAKEDAKKGKVFTKMIKEITILAKECGGEPASSPRLKTLIEKAKAANMPSENITRAIKKGTGELPGVNYEAQNYEGYGPYGVAVIVQTLTDNKNRTVSDMRRIFTRGGGSLAETGAVGWMFETKGVVKLTGKTTEDALLESLLDFEIEDISKYEDTFTIICDPKSVDQVKKAVEAQGLKVESTEIEPVPKNMSELNDEQAEKVVAFLEELEENDDVQNVYSNLA